MSACLMNDQVKNMRVSAVEWQLVGDEFDRIARYGKSMNPAVIGAIPEGTSPNWPPAGAVNARARPVNCETLVTHDF